MSVCFLTLLLLPPLCQALVGKLSSPSSSLLWIPLVWCLLALEFLQDLYLETFITCLFFFFLYVWHPQSLSLMGSVINPVKSYTISGEFAPAEVYCFRLDDFHGFFYNNVIFNSVILSNFNYVLSIRVLFHSVDNPFHRGLCVMNLKGPYDNLI